MSRKKTLKNVNIIYYASFANNISSLVESNGGRKIFAETIGVKYETIRNWCNGTRFPEGYQLLSIRDKYGISIDALLTSSDPELIYTPKVSESQAEYGACAESLDKWPDDIKNACRQVKKILQSDHPVIKPALLSNLAAFQYSVDKEESQVRNKIENLISRVPYSVCQSIFFMPGKMIKINIHKLCKLHKFPVQASFAVYAHFSLAIARFSQGNRPRENPHCRTK